MTRAIVFFQILYWLAAAGLLFLYGLGYGHWEVALIRNLYFPVVGLAISSAAIPFAGKIFLGAGPRALIPLLLFCAVAALVTAAILNPITFALLGEEIAVLPLEYLSADTLYFALFYFLWSQLIQKRLVPIPQGDDGGTESITVENRAGIKTLSLADLECVQSGGDYVELKTGSGSYLKKETLSNIAEQLPKADFTRVHRTTIVNNSKVLEVTSKGRGIYEITLASGLVVRSSRSYRDHIANILPPA